MRNMRAVRLSALVAALAVIISMLAAAPASAADTQKKLTIMVYMTGSDLESNYGAATNDITEMLRSHTDQENVNLIVMTGGSHKWWSGFPSDKSVIYEISGRRPQEVWSADVMNMGEAETLAALLSFGYANYPAEDYALILWNHGGGPLMGVCADELHVTSGVTDMLDMTELETALAMSPCAVQPLEWIGFDACLMSSIETACICAPYARYMIASQEVEPGTGWNYAFLSGISADADGAATGTRIVDTYFDYFGQAGDQQPLTMACIDLSAAANVETGLDSMFSQVDGILDENSFSLLSNKRRDTRALGRASTGSEYDLVDLYNLAQQYYDQAPEAAEALMGSIGSAVIYNRSNVDNANGLSIYYPYYNKEYYQYMWEAEYTQLFFAPAYTNYLRNFASIWLGESMTSWAGLKANALAPLPEKETTTLTMELTDEQLANFSGAEVYVMSHDATLDHYTFVYSSDEVALNGSTLTAEYNNTALYVLDAEGNPLTGSLEYHKTEDTYLIRAVLMEGEHELDGEAVPVYLQCRPVEGTSRLEIVGVIDISQELGLNSGKQQIDLDPEKWQTVSMLSYPAYATYDENGSLLPFSQWEDSSWIFSDYFANDQQWSIEFVEQNYNTDDFAAMITVTDTQGNEYASDMTHIDNSNIAEYPIEPRILVDNEFVTIELTGASYSTAAYDPCLRFHMRTTNKSDAEITVFTDHYLSGDQVISNSARLADAVLPGATVDTKLDLNAYKLLESNISAIETLRFDIKVNNGETLDLLCAETVVLDGPIDISPVMPGPATTAQPVTEPADGELSIELFGLEETSEGEYTAWLRYVNDTGTDYDTYTSDVIINGHAISDFMLHTLWLPSDTTLYQQVTLSAKENTGTIYVDDLPQLTDPCGYWGINSIESMSIRMNDPDYNSVYVEVALPGPIKLADSNTAAPAHTLYEDDRLRIDVRQVFSDGSEVFVVFHTENKTDRTLDIGIDSTMLNGGYVYTTSESDSEAYLSVGYEPMQLKPGLTERFMLGYSISELPEDTEIDTLSFCLSIGETGGEPVYYKPTVITLPDGLCAADITSDIVYFDQLGISELTPAVMLEPVELLHSEVIIPEAPSGYMRTVAAQLTGKQASAFDMGQLIIMQKRSDPDGNEIFRIICAADGLTLGDDGTVAGEYSGLLLVPADAPAWPITVIENSHSEGSIDMRSGYINLNDAQFQAETVTLYDILISGDDSGVQVTGASCENTSIRGGVYADLQHWYYDVVPEYGKDGMLIHYSYMASPNFSAALETAYADGKVQLQLRPFTAEDDVFALFAIWNKDGSGYCLEPVPLD